MCVYYVGVFSHEEGSGYLEIIATCYFVNSLFRSLGSIPLGFIPEEDLSEGEEIEI